VKFLTNEEEEITFPKLSSGQKDALSLLLAVEEKRMRNTHLTEEEVEHEDLIILLDGIESFLHPALQKRLLNYFFMAIERDDKQNLQIIIATHSETVLRQVDNKSIYLLSNASEDENRLKNLLNVESSDIFLGDMGISALSSDLPLLLVEGLLDEQVLSRLFPNIQSNFHIVNMGGKRT
jgi:predicted ATP-binding protein involved in virulence